MHQNRFRLGLRPRPRWGSLRRFPKPPSRLGGDRRLGRVYSRAFGTPLDLPYHGLQDFFLKTETKTKCSRPRQRLHDPRPRLSFLYSRRLETKTWSRGLHHLMTGSHMCSIAWWHFEWPWRTPNPVFKVTAFWSRISREKKRLKKCLTDKVTIAH